MKALKILSKAFSISPSFPPHSLAFTCHHSPPRHHCIPQNQPNPSHVLGCEEGPCDACNQSLDSNRGNFQNQLLGAQPCAGGRSKYLGPFSPINSRSFSKDPTAMGRSSPASPQITALSSDCRLPGGASHHYLSVAPPCERCDHTQRRQFSVATSCRGARSVAYLLLRPS